MSNLRPSKSSFAVLLTLAAVASVGCFWATSADVDCGIDRVVCGALIGAAGVAWVAGFGFGALLTSVLVLTSLAISWIHGRAKVLESGRKAWLISGVLIASHFFAFGLLGLLGVLPVGWEWWHGAFGVLAPLNHGPVTLVGQ
jgi:hypothetical protein